MRQNGLFTVERFMQERSPGPGRVYTAMLEGSRAIGVEVQSLVARSSFGPARRTAEGLDNRRLLLMAAVLEKYLRLSLSENDIFVNLAGGLSADEPALDLALCASILSSYREISPDSSIAFLGEVGLSGEIRPVGRIIDRIRELNALGFREFYVPESNRNDLGGFQGIHFLSRIEEIASAFQPSPENK
jgi:DNA repair protein RadA/Sms